jgi:hypothetical protein
MELVLRLSSIRGFAGSKRDLQESRKSGRIKKSGQVTVSVGDKPD